MKISIPSLLIASFATLACSAVQGAPKQPALIARVAPGQSCVPAWPQAALDQKRGGTTQLRLRVGAEGEVLSAKVVASSGSADLDQATIAAATACKFVPGTRSRLPPISSVVFTHVWERSAARYAAGLPAGTRAAARKPCAALAYPAQALSEGQQGTVQMLFVIGSDGAVLEKSIVKSSGFPLLDEAALEGMARCEFTPASSHGKPEQSVLPYSYTWTLERDT